MESTTTHHVDVEVEVEVRWGVRSPATARLVERVVLVLAVLLVLAAILAPFAYADWRPASQVPDVARWLPLAEQTWPTSPCNGREEVDVVDPSEMGGDYWGLAYMDGSCHFKVSTQATLMPLTACEVVVHETGHLAGMNHSPDPFDVMNAGGEGVRNLWWPPCVVATSMQRVVAEQQVTRLVGVPPDECSTRAATTVDCVVTRTGQRAHVAHYSVYAVGDRWETRRMKATTMAKRRAHG